jgi:putative ABC transport system ATP-binding protein
MSSTPNITAVAASTPGGTIDPTAPPLLQVVDLVKRYGDAVVFSNVDLTLRSGEFVAILGASGVGKSTLLNSIAGLDTVDGGRVLLDGMDVLAMPEAAQARLRRTHLGFVFQAFHVLPHLTVAQNVALPLMLLGTRSGAAGREQIKVRDARVSAVLASVGLQGLEERLPQQLSGGQLQRVAIARAVVHKPRLILADEPTGNLDPATAERVLDTLAGEVKREGTACVLVTHSMAAASRADRVLELTATGLIDKA